MWTECFWSRRLRRPSLPRRVLQRPFSLGKDGATVVRLNLEKAQACGAISALLKMAMQQELFGF